MPVNQIFANSQFALCMHATFSNDSVYAECHFALTPCARERERENCLQGSQISSLVHEIKLKRK